MVRTLWRKKLITVLLCFFSIAAEAQWGHCDYAEKSRGQKSYRLLDKVLTEFFPSSFIGRALDLGAGAGNEDLPLLARGWQVMAVDLCAESEEVIRSQAKGLPGVLSFQQASFASVKLQGLYDLVISFRSLPFGPRRGLEPLLAKVARHQASGAILAVNFYGYNADLVKHGGVYGISPKEVEAVLSQAGYEVLYQKRRQQLGALVEGGSSFLDIIDIIAQKK